jgi:hypothetical protein
MVRGNWQRRVELAESRRTEAKQRKHQTEEKKIYKQKAQKLLTALDRNKDALQSDKPWEIHIWCDSIPLDESSPVQENWNEVESKASSKGSKRRNRSTSIESESPAKPGRSKDNGKKKHPRSKGIVHQSPPEQFVAASLCRSHFFSGVRANKKTGKKNSYNYAYYPKTSKTLAEVLNSNEESRSLAKKVLALSELAHPDSQMDETEDSDSMEMVHYLSSHHSAGEMNSLSEHISGILSKSSCNIGSIVYFSFNETLLFDRYREGLLLTSDIDLRACLSMGKAVGSSSRNSSELGKRLPGSVLEYTLTFLSESDFTAMSRVCKPWNNVIGKESANLWRHFLERRGWPLTSLDDKEENIAYRKIFLSHYSAVRDSKAIQAGTLDVLERKGATNKEAFSRSFYSFKDSPQHPNICSGIQIWSPNHVLMAYSHECKLRLFSTSERSTGDGDKVCRELVCQNIDPYKNTKKKSCRLVDLAIDENEIGVLCRFEEEHSDKISSLLLFLSREEFLVSDVSVEEGTLNVVNTQQAIFDFLLDFEGVDEDQLQFLSFVSNGGDLDELAVLVSKSMVACGNGLFMIHALWKIPNDDGTDNENQKVCQKLFLFSSVASTIVSMSDINTEIGGFGFQESMTLRSSVTRDERGSYRCLVASTTPFSRLLTIGSIDSNGQIHNSVATQGIPMIDGFTLCDRLQRPMAITGSTIVVADSTKREIDENGTEEFKSVIYFYSRSENDAIDISYESVELAGNFEVVNIIPIREEHIIALCRLHPKSRLTDIDEIDGQWFGHETEYGQVSLFGIIFHGPTRTEIHRMCFLNDLESFTGSKGEVPLAIASNGGGTVVAGLWWRGVVMTGEEVRQIREEDQVQTPAKTKKKKKKTPKQGGKKDGYARGRVKVCY